MKNILIFATLIIALLGLNSCGEEDSALFNNKDAFFAFETNSSVKLENDIRTLRIPVSMAHSVAKGDVTFVIESDGFDNPAVEGVDFTVENTNHTLVFDGDHIENVKIRMIDNEERDRDKKFNIVLSSTTSQAAIGMANQAKAVHTVTISDNEHPLAALIGFDFEATEQSISKDDQGNQIPPYILPVQIRADTVPGRDDRLLVKGLLGVQQEVRMKFDAETGLVTIEEGQKYSNIVDPYFGIYIDLSFFGWEWYEKEDGTQGVKRFPEAVGTFDLDKKEIIFDAGYLTQITAPADHPYVGLAYNTLIIEYSRIAKKQ